MSGDAKAVLGSTVLIVIILILTMWFMQISCKAKSISFEDTRWSVFSGCIVKHNSKWLPLENIRGFDDK